MRFLSTVVVFAVAGAMHSVQAQDINVNQLCEQRLQVLGYTGDRATKFKRLCSIAAAGSCITNAAPSNRCLFPPDEEARNQCTKEAELMKRQEQACKAELRTEPPGIAYPFGVPEALMFCAKIKATLRQ